jgi:hypothetical protein
MCAVAPRQWAVCWPPSLPDARASDPKGAKRRGSWVMRGFRWPRKLPGWIQVPLWGLVFVGGILSFQVVDPRGLVGLRLAGIARSSTALPGSVGPRSAGQRPSLIPGLSQVRPAGAAMTGAPPAAIIAPAMSGYEHLRQDALRPSSRSPYPPRRSAVALGSSALYPPGPHTRQRPAPAAQGGAGIPEVGTTRYRKAAASVSPERPPVAPTEAKAEAASEGPTSASNDTQARKGQAGAAESAVAHQVSHAEAQAFAKAVLSEPKSAKNGNAAESGTPTPPQKGAQANAGSLPAPAPRMVTPRDARFFADYAARRRAAIEAMWPWWQAPPIPPPVMPPYRAYPYPPAYYYPPLP